MTMTTRYPMAAGEDDFEKAAKVIHIAMVRSDTEHAWELACACAQRFGSPHDAEFCRIATTFAQELPRSVREGINRVRLADGLHALVISGHQVDTDRLGPTPRHWREADTPGSKPYAFLLMLYGALLGDAIAWATQQDGRIVTDVLPVQGLEHSSMSAGSAAELTWHTEDAFSPYRADHVGLLCLRNRDQTSTTLASPDLERLPGDVLAVLRQPRFHVLPDSSHTVTFSASPEQEHLAAFDEVDSLRLSPPRVAVLDGSVEAPVLRIDRDFTKPAEGDAEAAAALRSLYEYMDQSVYELPLAAGDICFIDNRNAAHGRRAFQPRYDGQDRWLKRVNVVRDLRRTRSGRPSAGSRVIG